MIVVDADDTLWSTEQLYRSARDRAARHVESMALDPVEWTAVQERIDLELVESLGLSRERFPTACVRALEAVAELHGVEPRPEDLAVVREEACSVFRTPATLVDGVHGLVERLARIAPLVLLTSGDPGVQTARVAESGLEVFFADIVIVPRKTDDTFGELLGRHAASPRASWSVGNSLPSDINPALRSGMSAIWIPALVWSHELRETSPAPGRLFTLPTLAEAVALLESECGPGADS